MSSFQFQDTAVLFFIFAENWLVCWYPINVKKILSL